MRPYNSKLGLEFHEFRVIKDLGRKYPSEKSKCKSVFVVVECIHCKSELEGQLTHFKYGARQCLKCFPKKWKIQKDYTGRIFGGFEIVKDYMILEKGKQRKVIGRCFKCNKECEHNYYSFKNLKIVCDCDEAFKQTDEWKRIRAIYLGMVSRCHSQGSQAYYKYGEQGIKVCSEWLDDKRSFYEWSIKNGYKKNLTIDRIDNEKGYSPDNCRWATMKEQGRNKKDIMSIHDAREIKRLLSLGMTHKKIALLTNISHHAVSCISKGSTWSDID